VLCLRCATELPTEAAVCGMCGAAVEQQLTLALPPLPPETTSPAPVDLPQPPYAVFVSLALGLGLCLAVVAFNVSHNLAQEEWRVSAWSLAASLFAVVCMLLMPRTWNRIESRSDEHGRDKKILRRSAIFALLFIVIASLVGAKIGMDGREIGQLIYDLHEMSRISKRISRARNQVERNVPAHIAMYKELEPDVDAFGAVLEKLDAELPTYDDKFPNEHQQTLRTMNSVRIGLERAKLLEQQIAVARDIENLDSAARWQAWQERMQPLLDAETALDKGSR